MISPSHCRLLLRSVAALAFSFAVPAVAQMSLTTAVDLSLKNSPRVRMAQADVQRAKAALEESRDVYIPNLTGGGTGYGKSYGFPLGQPTIGTLQSQALAFSFSQPDYIRAAAASLNAARLSLTDVREAVAEDTALTYLALNHWAQREAALQQQQVCAEKLVTIIQARLDLGQDTALNLTSSRLTAAQVRLALLRTQDDAAADREHFSRLTGAPAGAFRIDSNGIELAPISDGSEAAPLARSPALEALYASAHAKREQAFGDARYALRPQLAFGAEYSRLSTFNNSNYQEYYGRRDINGKLLPFQSNTFGIGVQLTLPFFDYTHRAKARESAAEATHAEQDARQQTDLFQEAQLRMRRSVLELRTRTEIAELDQQLAQQQLEVIQLQLNAPAVGGAAAITPKDEQLSRITERDKYLVLIDTRYQLQQALVNQLRQTGALEGWLASLAHAPAAAPALNPQLHPAVP